MEINLNTSTEEKKETIENIRGYVWHNYKMKYAKDKKGFWLIVNYKKQKYFGFIEETILANAINNQKTEETFKAVIDNITTKITAKQQAI